MKKESANSIIIRLLGVRPVAFNPVLAHICKSANGGLLLSQLLYWHEKGTEPDWTYKTMADFERETCLTRKEQDTAIKLWKKLGVLETKVAGLPAKRYFKIHEKRLAEIINNHIGKKILEAYEDSRPI